MTAALAVRCPWCSAAPGEGCETIAAHPVTGRAMPWPVQPHPERLALAAPHPVQVTP